MGQWKEEMGDGCMRVTFNVLRTRRTYKARGNLMHEERNTPNELDLGG
jgi:hypothetical protein